jgi:hypothetical protein
MKLILTIALALMITGCSVFSPPGLPFPDEPNELKGPAPVLIPLTDTQHNLSDLLQNASDNYTNYYLLKNKYEAWQQWYTEQAKIYNDASKKLAN